MMTHVATVTIICLIILSLMISANGSSNFMVYNEPKYGGRSDFCTDYCNVSRVISFKIIVGTCGQIKETKTGNTLLILKDNPDTDYYYDGSLSTCPTYKRIIECPKGTFVKGIEWTTEDELKMVVKMSCSKPESSSTHEAHHIFSHPESTSSFSNKVWCSGFTEIPLRINVTKEVELEYLLGKDCKPNNVTENDKTLECDDMTVLSGMVFTIETETNYIKTSKLICSDVPNIASLCKAEDRKQKLLPTMNKTVGVEIISSSAMSESEKNQFSFYNKFKLETEYALSTNFKDNIGKSNTTGYDWRSAPKSTWQKEQNITIQIEKSAKCNTGIFEIVGKCSYMTIRPYYIERVDHCLETSFTTLEEIPHNIHKSSYLSKIPDSIKNIGDKTK